MRFALAVLLPTVLLASGVLYHASTVSGSQELARAADTQPADAKPADAKDKENLAASPGPGEKAEKAALPATGAKGGESSTAVKAVEPSKTAPVEKDGSPSTAASAAKPVAALPVAEKPAVKMPPLKGSHIADDNSSCIQCHTSPDAWDPKDKAQYQFFLGMDGLKKDVHYQKGVNCVDCHGGDSTILEPKAHQAKDDFRAKLPDIQRFCAHCHEKDVALMKASPHKSVNCLDCHANADAQGKISPHTISASMKEKLSDQVGFCGKCHAAEVTDLRKSVHAKAGAKNAQGEGSLMICGECHGQPSHNLLPVKDAKSPVRLAGQVNNCGRCHQENQETFLRSVHGQAMEKMGLSVGPGCADCHGSHNVERKTVFESHIADTCGKCHVKIEDRLRASVHGRGGLGGRADRPAPGGKTDQKPTCTSCHQGHDLPSPESLAFREALPGHCGNCHGSMSSTYALSMHGKLTDLGYGPAAKCADCHGAHDILPLKDPDSRLSPAHRAETCQKCHPGASTSFVKFDPHCDHTDPQRSPVVNAVYRALMTLLLTTFALFGLHSVLWLIRGVVQVFTTGRAHGLSPGGEAYVRFHSFHRIGHTCLLVSFLGLALTGLPLKYHYMDWAKQLAQAMGGFGTTGFWHRFFAIITFVCFFVYVTRIVRLFFAGRRSGKTTMELMFGPDSPLPNLRDLKDFLKMLRWFFGLGPKPTFERWSYWEKFDMWGATADIVIIGATGMVLWFPQLFTRILPGTALNVAQVIHSTQALLATGFVFAIHFFNTHFRPDKFPMDLSALTGLVSEKEFQEERPDYFQRLEREGKLQELRSVTPGPVVLWCIRTLGFLALSVGLALLLGMILASLS